MQLKKIKLITAQLELMSGMRIGGSDTEIRIGGVDNQVIRNSHTGSPYIPGSSVKGRMRSLLEWRSGAVETGPLSIDSMQQHGAVVRPILQLFGVGGGKLSEDQARDLGPTRLSFWDASLNADWIDQINRRQLMLTEIKTENSINRISGTAENPRQTERVPAGAIFDFRLSMKMLDVDEGNNDALLDTVLSGLRMLELDSLGGSGSRGYGKLRFNNLMLDQQPLQERFDAVDPFAL